VTYRVTFQSGACRARADRESPAVVAEGGRAGGVPMAQHEKGEYEAPLSVGKFGAQVSGARGWEGMVNAWRSRGGDAGDRGLGAVADEQAQTWPQRSWVRVSNGGIGTPLLRATRRGWRPSARTGEWLVRDRAADRSKLDSVPPTVEVRWLTRTRRTTVWVQTIWSTAGAAERRRDGRSYGARTATPEAARNLVVRSVTGANAGRRVYV